MRQQLLAKAIKTVSAVLMMLMGIIVVMPSFFVIRNGYSSVYEAISIIALPLALVLLLTTLYRFVPRIVIVILATLSFLAVATVIIVVGLNMPLSANSIAIIRETNVQEAVGLAVGLPFYLYFIGIVFIILLYLSLKYPVKLPRLVWLQSIFLSAGVFCAFLFAVLKTVPAEADNFSLMNPQDLDLYISRTEEVPRRAFPFSLSYILNDHIEQRRELLHYADTYKDYRFNIAHMPVHEERQVYVLVIGETSRYDHWGVNGYTRNTSPQLSARSDLLTFQNIYTYSSFTRFSVPVLMSRKPINSTVDFFEEASIFAYFKQIGFETAWISVQPEYDRYASPIGVYAYEADHVYFLNENNLSYRTRPDSDAIPYVQNLINATDKNLFIIIHALGSHQRYTHRYDGKHAVFLPDRYEDREANIFSKDDAEVFINSYDNSIVASDDFLNGLIEALDTQDLTSFMFFTSDHGEGLFDDGNRAIGHGYPSFATLHVPLFFWASPKYQAQNFELMEGLASNQKQLAGLDTIFETLVSLSGGELADARPYLDLTKNQLVVTPVLAELLREHQIIK